jgi:cysteine synthase A
VVYVTEQESVAACRALVRHGYVFGGSTGSVVSGARRWLRENPDAAGDLSVAIAPDLGERYLDMIYRDSWVLDRLGPAGLDHLDSIGVRERVSARRGGET